MTTEQDIRRALEAQADDIKLPRGLAARTVKAAKDAEAPSWGERLRSIRDARIIGGRVTGYPRSLQFAAGLASLLMLIAVGSLVQPDSASDTGRAIEPLAVTPAEPQQLDLQDDGAANFGEADAETPALAPESRASTAAGSSGGTTSGSADSGPLGLEEPIEPPSGDLVTTDSLPPAVARTAEISVEVDRGAFDEAWGAANDVASRYGGFVTGSNTEQVEGRAVGTLIARVPAADLDKALKDLRRLGTMDALHTSGHDVSGQLVDLEARLDTAREEETQLRELLDRARNVDEVLRIRNRLDDVRLEIELLDARRQNVQNQVDFATVTATVFEAGSSGDGRESGVIGQAWDAAVTTAMTLVAGVVYVLIGFLPLAGLGVLVWLGLRTRRARRDG